MCNQQKTSEVSNIQLKLNGAERCTCFESQPHIWDQVTYDKKKNVG